MSEHHEDKDDQATSSRGKHGRDKNEGEGKGVRRHVESGASEHAVDEAQRAVESDEGDELRRAEDEAKSGRER